jgi:hypothetical protein
MIRFIAKIVSIVALIAVILPSVFFLAGRMELPMVKWIMLLATIVWFASASTYMWKEETR